MAPRNALAADEATQPSTEVAPQLREGDHNPFANMLLTHAQTLRDERDSLTKRIAANRDSLRNLRDQKLMDDEQAQAVEEFYPTRHRRNTTNGAATATATSE